MEFQAETRQLLDIVTHSLYTDREVFLRELVSNASDALEKLRHLRAAGGVGGGDGAGGDDDDGGGGGGVPLEIRIETDEAANTLTITDTGVGMTRAELVSNLGTIARSGSKAFVEEMRHKEMARGAGGGLRSVRAGDHRLVRRRILLRIHGRGQGRRAVPIRGQERRGGGGRRRRLTTATPPSYGNPPAPAGTPSPLYPPTSDRIEERRWCCT
jgi:hypothetical protein